MAKQKDIQVGADHDLLFAAGDLVVGEAESQNLEHLLLTVPGGSKHEPATGAGVILWSKRRMNQSKAYTFLSSQLKRDGFINPEINIKDWNIGVSAERSEV